MRFRTRMATAGLVLIAVAALRGQDQERAFRDGFEAQAKERWADAVTQMRAAVRANPKESKEKIRWGGVGFGAVRAGGVEVEYVPHFFLGKGLYRLGECAAALEAWAASEQYGVVQTIPSFISYVREGYAQCEKRGVLPSPRFEAASASAQRQIDLARSAAEDASTRARAAGDLFTPERRTRLGQATGEIKQAESRLDAAKKARAAAEFTEAHNATERSLAISSGLSAELEAAMGTRRSAIEALAELDRALTDAAGIERAVDAKKAFLTSALAATRQQGLEVLERARRVADSARPAIASANVSVIAEARRDVSSASTQLQRVFEEVVDLERKNNESRNAQAVRLAREKFSLVDKAFTTFDARNAARPSTDPGLASERRTIEQRVRAARRQLDAAVKAGDASGIEAATRLAEQAGGRVVELTETFGALTLEERGVHPLLAQATRHFLNSDYEQALTALRPSQPFPPDMPFIEHAYVFRAAALHHLAAASGASDATLLAQAREAVAALQALNPTFTPDPRVFSPRFLAFFRGAGQPASVANGSARP